MKTLKEFAVIKNLNTSDMKVVSDDGNIEDINDGGNLDPFGDIDNPDMLDDGHAYRPDGTHDGLDDFDSIPFEDDEPVDGEDQLDGISPEGNAGGELPGDELPPEGGLEGEADAGLGMGEEEQQEEDPDFQGVIRTVTGACLVYKRKTEDGTFEELWLFNIGKNMRNEVKIRRAILAGTDIGPQDIASEDGTQEVETTTVGNVQFLRITGLPN